MKDLSSLFSAHVAERTGIPIRTRGDVNREDVVAERAQDLHAPGGDVCVPGRGVKKEIPSMPGQYNLSVDQDLVLGVVAVNQRDRDVQFSTHFCRRTDSIETGDSIRAVTNTHVGHRIVLYTRGRSSGFHVTMPAVMSTILFARHSVSP